MYFKSFNQTLFSGIKYCKAKKALNLDLKLSEESQINGRQSTVIAAS